MAHWVGRLMLRRSRAQRAGNDTAAANQIGAFVNQVRALVNDGTLTPEQGDDLIAAAEAALVGLG